MVLDGEGPHGSRWQAIVSIAAKIGCSVNTLNDWVKKVEVDSGRRAGVSTDMAAKLKALERDNRELRQANEILRKASAYLRWRSSTASRSDGVVHRCASGDAWGRERRGESTASNPKRGPALLPGLATLQ